MEITLSQYSLFAANVYGNSSEVRLPANTLPVPEGWRQQSRVNDKTTGFMASSFVKDNQVVISYAGTTPGAPDWFTGNIPAATGVVLAPQILQAACFYIDTLELLKVDGELPSNLMVSFKGPSLREGFLREGLDVGCHQRTHD